MTLARVGTFTTYLTATLLEKEFNNIACRFGRITGGDLNISPTVSTIDYYAGDSDYDLVTNIANAVAVNRPLYLPAGTYTASATDATCNLPDNLIIRGAGIDRTIIIEKVGNTVDALITVGGGANTGVGVILSNLTIRRGTDFEVGGHTHDLFLISIEGGASTNFVLDRIKFDLLDYSGTLHLNAVNFDSTITDIRTGIIQSCHFDASYYFNDTHAIAVYASGVPVRLTVTESVFKGWYKHIMVGDAGGVDTQYLEVTNCYFELGYLSASLFTATAVTCIGGGQICGNVFCSISVDGASTSFITAINDTDIAMQIMNNIMQSTSIGPAVGVAISGDNFIVMGLTESYGSAGFTSGLLQLTGLDTGASNCWWDGITALDVTQNILPAACTKRGARSIQYAKEQITGYEHLLSLDNCNVRIRYSSPYNYVHFQSLITGWSPVQAKMQLVGVTNIAD